MAAKPVSLSPDASAVVAEEVQLQLLARDAALDLTAEEWAALGEVILEFQAVRQAYEATIARAAVTGVGCYRLDIPAYPIAGEALREKLFARIRERLGAPTADEVEARLGTVLAGHFAGFGASVQTLDFTADPSGAESEYQVTRTIQLGGNTGASGQVATRQETFFPGLEDPRGDVWGPFLSVLAAHVAAKTGS